jgi:hypothetical protein
MASGYLDLAYLIEISVVFNLAYREIKHGNVLEKMKNIRENMFQDKELQERIEKIEKDNSLSGESVNSSYKKLASIIECDSDKLKDCEDEKSNLCEAWNHKKKNCKYFVNIILVGKGLLRVNVSIIASLLILFFATIFPHIGIVFNAGIWWALFSILVITILIPIHLLYMSKKISNILIGGNGNKGLIEDLKEEFNTKYNKYLGKESKQEAYFYDL